jgi:hypothetical protein
MDRWKTTISSQPIVIVQVISTVWTKESRGAPNAELRNKTPEAIEVPIEPTSFDRPSLLLHKVTYGEFKNFQTPVCNQIEIIEMPERFDSGCVSIYPTTESVKVIYEHCFAGGAPYRHIRKEFHINLRQWAQVVYNGRHSLFDKHNIFEYRYEKCVVNIGLYSIPVSHCFLHSEPVNTTSALALLK